MDTVPVLELSRLYVFSRSSSSAQQLYKQLESLSVSKGSQTWEQREQPEKQQGSLSIPVQGRAEAACPSSDLPRDSLQV